jgi:hypothetical protein
MTQTLLLQKLGQIKEAADMNKTRLGLDVNRLVKVNKQPHAADTGKI